MSLLLLYQLYYVLLLFGCYGSGSVLDHDKVELTYEIDVISARMR